MSARGNVTFEPISEAPGSTLMSWNETTPESPNGERLTYFRKPNPEDEEVRNFTGEFGVTTLEEVQHNRKSYPEIDEPGLYTLDCDSDNVTKIVTLDAIHDFFRSHGYTPDENDKFCHVMPNFDMSRAMTRWVPKEEGILFSCNMDGNDMVIFPKRPTHQLWYDNETYFAVNIEQFISENI